MQNAKLIDYLKALNTREFSQIEVLINQYSKTPQLVDFFKLLVEYAPDYDNQELEKGLICKVFFSDSSKKNLKNLTALSLRLCSLIEKYWIQKEIEKQDYHRERLLLEVLKERCLDKYFFKEIEKSKKGLSQKTILDQTDYQHLLHLECERYFHPHTSKYDTEDNGMQEILNLIENYYTANKLKYFAEAKQIEMITNQNFEYFELDKIIASAHLKTNNPLSQMYFLIIQLLSKKEDDWEAIHDLMVLFERHIDNIHSKDEKLGILNFLINYASAYYTKNIAYYEVLFQNLKLGMEQFLLIENGFLHEHYFVNTCVIACELNHATWLENYTKNYIQYVHKDKQENAAKMGNVCLLYAKGEFSKILTVLIDIGLEKINENFWYRTMQLRCLFELDLKEQGYELILESRIEAFRRYCYRQNDLHKQRIVANLNFIKNLIKIQEWEILSASDKSNLVNDIKTEATVCRLWLLKIVSVLR
jgi:hypothetical protein